MENEKTYEQGKADMLAAILKELGVETLEEVKGKISAEAKEEPKADEAEEEIKAEVEPAVAEEPKTEEVAPAATTTGEVLPENEEEVQEQAAEETANIETPAPQQDHEADYLSQIQVLKEENDVLKAEKLAAQLGIKEEYREDIIALLKGKGLEFTEVNIKDIVKKHPEWKATTSTSVGTVAGNQHRPEVDERVMAARYFGN